MKIIFLDIDGVLNHKPKMYGFDKRCVSIFKRILDLTGAKIVVSSSWRYFKDSPPIEGPWRDTLANMLGRTTDVFIGETPDICMIDMESGKFVRRRGLEIQTWLDENRGYKHKYCILDDDVFDFDGFIEEKHIFKTNPNIGITNELADNIIEFLNGRKPRINKRRRTNNGRPRLHR